MESQNHNKLMRCGAKLTDHQITCTGAEARRHVSRIIRPDSQKKGGIFVLSRNIPARRAVSQRFQEVGQAVVVYFMHQSEQSANFSRGETLARKPGQVISGQIGDQRALVLAKRHFERHQALQVFGVHVLLNRPRA